MVRQVTSGFFPTMGIRVVSGRGFAATDRRGAPGVAVVNEAFAHRFFPGENPLGQRVNLRSEGFRLGGNGFMLGEQSVDQVEVVGVVADVKYASLSQPAEESLYLSHEQATFRVISYSVTQRQGEIAVRAAIGASAAQVLRLIMQRGVRLALGGVAAGVIGAVALRQILASQLYEISALDLRVLLLVPVALLVVALLASFLPAWRATAIDPAALLRAE